MLFSMYVKVSKSFRVVATAILLASVVVGVSACGATFPKDGTPSAYDGKWSGTLPASGNNCDNITAEAEIRFGFMIAKIYQQNHKQAEAWGQIGDDGHLKGHLGMAGVTAGSVELAFDGDNASGSWESQYCKGTFSVERT